MATRALKHYPGLFPSFLHDIILWKEGLGGRCVCCAGCDRLLFPGVLTTVGRHYTVGFAPHWSKSKGGLDGIRTRANTLTGCRVNHYTTKPYVGFLSRPHSCEHVHYAISCMTTFLDQFFAP